MSTCADRKSRKTCRFREDKHCLMICGLTSARFRVQSVSGSNLSENAFLHLQRNLSVCGRVIHQASLVLQQELEGCDVLQVDCGEKSDESFLREASRVDAKNGRCPTQLCKFLFRKKNVHISQKRCKAFYSLAMLPFRAPQILLSLGVAVKVLSGTPGHPEHTSALGWSQLT